MANSIYTENNVFIKNALTRRKEVGWEEVSGLGTV